MANVSRSPQRYTFQKEVYFKRCAEKGEEPNDDYLEYFDSILDQENHKWDDPKSRINNMEWDLLTTDWILEKVRKDISYAQNLYAAMCNNDFIKRDLWPILKEQKWSCSWRYAGGIVADMRQEGDYIDWYCSGIKNEPSEEEWNSWTPEQQISYTNIYSKFVTESVVTEEIERDLFDLGWIVVKYNGEE